ncbi:hypothetical protein [Rhizobium leguminosarum]|uniref:hypothetical protein n=1 Tax=Rhizobium leguminosarum TaxID=384 RepID=UPI001FE02E97|nr:hypothetical protein [Rhizobium leguminosarum]
MPFEKRNFGYRWIVDQLFDGNGPGTAAPSNAGREQFLSYAAGAVVAGMYCGKLELNADFFLGYEYATGVYPPLDPNFRPEMARVEKDAKSDLDNYCKVARLMFYKGNKPKPLAALVDKQ